MIPTLVFLLSVSVTVALFFADRCAMARIDADYWKAMYEAANDHAEKMTELAGQSCDLNARMRELVAQKWRL